MPDRDESTASIPSIDPELWEDFQGLRETFLLHVADPNANESLRTFGCFLYNLLLEAGEGAFGAESATRSEIRAALADLRFLQGFLGAVGMEGSSSSLAPEDVGLSALAGREALELARVADRIETELEA
jgi:hypothetical protein